MPGNEMLIIWDENKIYKASPNEPKSREMEDKLKKGEIVITNLFLIGYLFSLMIESGQLPDGSYPAILLFLGGLGPFNIFLFYLLSVLVIGVKFYLNSKKSRIIHTARFR